MWITTSALFISFQDLPMRSSMADPLKIPCISMFTSSHGCMNLNGWRVIQYYHTIHVWINQNIKVIQRLWKQLTLHHTDNHGNYNNFGHTRKKIRDNQSWLYPLMLVDYPHDIPMISPWYPHDVPYTLCLVELEHSPRWTSPNTLPPAIGMMPHKKQHHCNGT